MFWLIITILAYFILAVVFLVDKYLLSGDISNPKVYAFYVGVLGISVLILVPFVGFSVPEKSEIILGLSAGVVFIYGLFWLYKTVQLFEPSRVVPAIGGLTSLFTFCLIYFLTWEQESFSPKELSAFILLVLGSVVINLKKEKLLELKSLKFSVLTAFLLAVSFILSKYTYLALSFWNGFIWRCIGGFLMAICFFVFFPEVKKEIFKKREKTPSKTAVIFLSNQVAGAAANVLQNWAIALSPLIYIPFINALQGTQYAFLFILTIILSLTWPFWAERAGLKEKISWQIIFQKIIAILIISGGLALLVLK